MKTLEQIANHVNAIVHGDAQKKISAVASLAAANASHVAFFDNPVRLKWLHDTQAGAVVLTQQYVDVCPTNALIVNDPAIAITQIQNCLESTNSQRGFIHPNALISLSCELGQNVSIGANSYIGEGVVLGDNVTIGVGCVIEADAYIGANSSINHASVVHHHTIIGDQVEIDSGTVIGAFPFNGVKSGGIWQRGPSYGSVIIEDNVHVGANTVIDRGGYTDTIISRGVIIDNLVQIAHDTVIGPYTAIAGCAAIGANCEIGSHCIIGGASTIAANVYLADEVVVTGMSTVSKSLKKAGIFSSGTMVSEHQHWRKNVVRFRQLENWVDRIKALEIHNQLWLNNQNHVSE
ncbi:UDP-3-O-(3-hydroxymyristoyl)glucosamine N-acyltransferase [Legionella sp. W05-934-2]|uniref:UDP-3-O-(3-hydroxymyristoyl)glucosamine N-acyltransferase n=1 Tax=Legionella sp. W05-934-2 TaxID=1198649 RepID=UPI003462635B